MRSSILTVSSRTGIPEVIYSAGKTPSQVAEIAARMNERGIPVLATRAEPEVYEAVREKIPGAIYHEMAKAIVYQPRESGIFRADILPWFQQVLPICRFRRRLP